MSRTSGCLVVAVAVLASVQVAAPAFAAVSASRAEMDESELRIEGTASPGRDITVDGVVMARSDSSGEFRIQRAPYSPPADCTVDVGDGSATTTPVSLSGCTATQTPPPSSADTTPPSVPTNLAARLTASTADLTWTASNDDVEVAGYRVSRNGAPLPGTATGTSSTDPDLAAGTYTYTVAAVDAAGNVSGASNSASVTVPTAEQPPPADTSPPSVPTEFNAVLRNTDNIDLTWRESTDDTAVHGYRIMRNGEVLPDICFTLFYNDSQLAPNTYTYSVAAVDTAGNMSQWTQPMSVTVAAPPPPVNDVSAPSVPTNLSTTVIGTTVNLGWSMSSDDTGITGYHVYRNGLLLTTLGAPRDGYSDLGLAAGTYTYTVSAFDAAGNTSAQSTGVTATVQADQGLYFITPAQMPDATSGQAYLGYIVSSDPTGPSTFKFKLVSGEVPDGTRFSGNTLENRPEARVTGTPSRVGTFTFTVQVKDNTGATARRTFIIEVVAGS